MRSRLVPVITFILLYWFVQDIANQKWFSSAIGFFCVLATGLNLLALVFNGWKMPVKIDRNNNREIAHKEKSRTHSVMTEHTRLKFLCDFCYFGLVYVSIGDLMVLIAVLLFIFGIVFGLI